VCHKTVRTPPHPNNCWTAQSTKLFFMQFPPASSHFVLLYRSIVLSSFSPWKRPAGTAWGTSRAVAGTESKCRGPQLPYVLYRLPGYWLLLTMVKAWWQWLTGDCEFEPRLERVFCLSVGRRPCAGALPSNWVPCIIKINERRNQIETQHHGSSLPNVMMHFSSYCFSHWVRTTLIWRH
jgi:hypothetical protein